MEGALLPLHYLFDTSATSGKPVKINKKNESSGDGGSSSGCSYSCHHHHHRNSNGYSQCVCRIVI